MADPKYQCTLINFYDVGNLRLYGIKTTIHVAMHLLIQAMGGRNDDAGQLIMATYHAELINNMAWSKLSATRKVL